MHGPPLIKAGGLQGSVLFYDFTADGSLITVNADPLLNGWIVAYEDSEQLVLYYSKPLACRRVHHQHLQRHQLGPQRRQSIRRQKRGTFL